MPFLPAASGAPAPAVDPPFSTLLWRPLPAAAPNGDGKTGPPTPGSMDLAGNTEFEWKLSGIFAMGPVESWFPSREFEFDAAADSPAMLAEAGGCVFPDSYLRSLGGGRDECGALTPGQDDPAILALPFLALSGWVLTIGAVAGLGGFYRSWRTWRWARCQGVTPRRADRRRSPERHARRSISATSAGKPRSRRYARPT